MTTTTSRSRPKRARKPRARSKPGFPTLVLIPASGVLPREYLLWLQFLADDAARIHGDYPQRTEDRRAEMADELAVHDGYTTAAQRAAWRRGRTDLTTPAADAA